MGDGHPQNSPRGLFSKQAIKVIEGDGLFFDDYSKRTAILTADTNNLQVRGGIRVSAKTKGVITANDIGLSSNGSGVVFSAPGAGIPSSVDRGAALHISSNSTGVALALNTTGTTWKYFSVTSVQAT